MTAARSLRTTVGRVGVYRRGNKLYLRFQDATGKWKNRPSGCDVGQEDAAYLVLEEVERRVAEQRAAAGVVPDGPGALLLRDYAERWLDLRDTATRDDDAARIRMHILPALGHIPIAQLRPKQIRDFVKALQTKTKAPHRRKDGTAIVTDELLAPRTVRHIYGTLRVMMKDAVADELIATSPCVLKAGELPAKADKDRTWRRGAVFTADEVETIITADAIPEDRRTFYAIMFVGCTRFGEASALTWADYDVAIAPLGKLMIERSYDSKSAEVKATKTDNPREMPVHPTLAKVLADWKAGGFERLVGRAPQSDDLIVPSRRGKHRTARHMLRRFHEDLERVGLRARRQHDTRRTFISIARAGGAGDLLRWATHGPTSDILDVYTTPPWAALCVEVAKAAISASSAKVIELPIAAAVGSDPGSAVPVPFQSDEGPEKTNRHQGLLDGDWRSGRDLKQPTSHARAADEQRGEVISLGSARAARRERATGTAKSFHEVADDPIMRSLEAAAESWRTGGDRLVLVAILEVLLRELRT